MLKKDVRRALGTNYELLKETVFKTDTETRIKTELCRNWESGSCEYGEKCNFAHGQHELRDKFGVKTMKEKCEQFFKSGYCISGSKCLFSHFEEVSSIRRKSPQPNQQDRIFQLNPPIFIDLESRNT